MGVTRVKITKDGIEASCMPSAVKAWERNGWTRADDGSSEPEAEEKPAKKKTTSGKAE